MDVLEPPMGMCHRLPNNRGNCYANRYPSSSPINRIFMVTNNYNDTGIVASGVYVWYTSTWNNSSDRQFKQCSSGVCGVCYVSLNVTSNRSRSAKTQVGTSQINSLASSGFNDSTPHRASTSEEQALPAVFPTATPSSDFNYSHPAITIISRPVTARAPPEASHNASGVFTVHVNKRAYHLQSSIICGYPRFSRSEKAPPHRCLVCFVCYSNTADIVYLF
jgi:hypothetical protein